MQNTENTNEYERLIYLFSFFLLAIIFYYYSKRESEKENENEDEAEEWIKEAIFKEHIKLYEYQHFSDFQKIGSGAFGIVYRANWKNSGQYFALKSFLDNATFKELVREVINKYLIFPK